jgi:hypothetical protein
VSILRQAQDSVLPVISGEKRFELGFQALELIAGRRTWLHCPGEIGSQSTVIVLQGARQREFPEEVVLRFMSDASA